MGADRLWGHMTVRPPRPAPRPPPARPGGGDGEVLKAIRPSCRPASEWDGARSVIAPGRARARRPPASPPPVRRAGAAAEPGAPLSSPAVSREGPKREVATPWRWRPQLFRAGLVGGVGVLPAGPPALY